MLLLLFPTGTEELCASTTHAHVALVTGKIRDSKKGEKVRRTDSQINLLESLDTTRAQTDRSALLLANFNAWKISFCVWESIYNNRWELQTGRTTEDAFLAAENLREGKREVFHNGLPKDLPSIMVISFPIAIVNLKICINQFSDFPGTTIIVFIKYYVAFASSSLGYDTRTVIKHKPNS